MEHRHLGRSGLTLSELGLGCNNFGMKIDAGQAAAVVRRALDEGITHFDTAETYGGGRSEEMLGAALGGHRDEVVIATKFGHSNGPSLGAPGGRRNIIRACEDSLRRLGTDRIDLYYLHRPDPSTPVEETLEALSDLVRAGKVRYIANSVMPAWQMADADHVARSGGHQRYVGAQVEWSLLSRDVEVELVPACEHFGIGVVPFFPLASGLLTGKYRAGEPHPEGSRFATLPRLASAATSENYARVERLTEWAEANGRTILELALGWLLSQPVVSSVIAGATTPEQVSANVQAATTWRLSPAERTAVDQLLAGETVE